MQMTDRQKKIWGIATIIGLVVFMGLLCWFVGRPMIRFVSEPEKFRLWVDEHGIWGRLAFIGMVILQIIVAIIPGEPLEIGAGYAFGAVEGTILCLTGAVLGGAIVVLLVRRYGIKLVEVFFPKEKIMSLRFMQDSRRLELLVFIVFMIPGTPKDLLCYAVGLTNQWCPTPAPLSRHRRQRPGGAKLCFCGGGICSNAAHQFGRHPVVPAHLPEGKRGAGPKRRTGGKTQ